MRACVRLTREIFAQPAFAPFAGRELQPGAGVTTDDGIDAFIRAKVESAYHPCGACKMGRDDDPMAVVDPQTRVIGLEGLRVVDSSIMPSVTTGNLNAPDPDDRREGGRPDSGPTGAGGVQRPLLRRRKLARGSAVVRIRLPRAAR